ncbi:hypothetical protein PSTT_08081 [Puccinia striiformis]|uniref:Uncharacterized protein n=1 Tax=Puccinia striiformis TaxID=27350 RepID=A0A2S4VDN8_9BASI|nr:hypothetical protein PSTT_08081 [Puccinia striiformis]
MKLELEDKIQRQEEKTVVIVAAALLLTTLTRSGTQGIPHNDLPLSVTTPTFMFICRELPSFQMELVSKLLQIEEQPAIFLYVPSHEAIPHQIQSNPKFSPFFDKCLGALDGVHIPASVPAHKNAPYRNQEGFLSQNLLGVCDFGI